MLSAKRCMLIMIFVVMLLFAGCADSRRLTVDEGKAVAIRYGITAPVVWKELGGKTLATQDGYIIYCDIKKVARCGLSDRLGELLLHEQYHIQVYDHCKNPKCLMYFEYNTHGIKKLCGRCKKPTTQDWMKKIY